MISKNLYICKMKTWLLGKSLDQLREIVVNMSLPAFSAKQIAEWIYKKNCKDIMQMSNISKANRDRLSEQYQVGGFSPEKVTLSLDGTKKYLFPSLCETFIESVTIPEDDRVTLCVSSQAGCRMGCKFCMTARVGYKGNLTAGEIISQLQNVEESNKITNIVFMGMGEPLDNFGEVSDAINILTADWGFAWSPKRITVSSIGVHEPLIDLLNNYKCHLAISLHNPFEEERLEFVPAQKAWPFARTLDIIRRFDFTGQRRVSFEYIMFDGWNDSKRHADALIRTLKGLECRVNLIHFHQIPDFPYKPTPNAKIELFRERLNKEGLIATIRASRGEDILAACGMLSGKNINK